MAGVKLLGYWLSPYSTRVIWGLKLKGIPFEYLEQDLVNKSPLLLQNNPVHKKVPVLIHNEKPICESMIILEYLDETWPNQYPLMPADPGFGSNISKISGSIWKIYRTKGEEQEEALKDTHEMLKTIEERAMGGVGDNKYFGGDTIGIVDIAYGAIAHWLGMVEKVAGIQILDPHKFPKLHAWTLNFKQTPVISENLPDFDKMVAEFKGRRKLILSE